MANHIAWFILLGLCCGSLSVRAQDPPAKKIISPLRTLDNATCPSSSVAVPADPAGSSHPIFYNTVNWEADPHNTSGPTVERCCPNGQIAFWNLTTTSRWFPPYLGSLGALCSDGTALAPVTYGANDTQLDACPAPLGEPQLISTPEDGNYTYWNGAIVDQFLGVGGAAEREPYSMQCPDGQQAIGFKVSSSCFALTALQIVCGIPELASGAETSLI